MTDERLTELLNGIINEIGRSEERTNHRFDNVDSRLNQLKSNMDFQFEQVHHELNACKLNLDTTGLLLQKVTDLEKRVEHLEQAI